MPRIVSRTWEWTGERWKLVLDHVFYGDTIDEAAHYLDSHLKADAFLRGCVEQGRFEGRVVCHTETWSEQ